MYLSIIILFIAGFWSPGNLPVEGSGALAQVQFQRQNLLPSREKDVLPAAARHLFASVERGLQEGSADSIAPSFANRVFLQLLDGDAGYHSAAQASQILSAFFRSHGAVPVGLSSYGTSDGSPYATGTVRSAGGILRVYVALSASEERPSITHLTIY